MTQSSVPILDGTEAGTQIKICHIDIDTKKLGHESDIDYRSCSRTFFTVNHVGLDNDSWTISLQYDTSNTDNEQVLSDAKAGMASVETYTGATAFKTVDDDLYPVVYDPPYEFDENTSQTVALTESSAFSTAAMFLV